jgi:DNA-binding MarR family transcriptional regulator
MVLYGHQAGQLSRTFKKVLNEQLQDSHLYAGQWGLIMFLYTEGPHSQRAIADYMKVEAPTLTRMINRLNEEGWIKKEEGLDRRKRIIGLTDEAKEHYQEWKDISDKIEKKATRGISEEELEIFRKVSEKMITNLDGDKRYAF